MNKAIKALLFGAGGSTPIGDVGLLILRAGSGLMMAFGHGMSKMFGEGRFGPSEQMIGGVQKMGLPAPTFFAWCSALAEFVAALLLATGLLTRPAAFVLTINMLVAAFIAHSGAPLFATGAGPAKEMALLYLLPFVTLLLTGPGRFSLDRLIFGRAESGRGLLI